MFESDSTALSTEVKYDVEEELRTGFVESCSVWKLEQTY